MKIERPQASVDLEIEYARVSENEGIYLDEIGLWNKLNKINGALLTICFVLFSVIMFSLPYELAYLMLEYPLVVLVVFIIGGFGFGGVFGSVISSRISGIKSELGLSKRETLYLRSFETHRNIDSFLEESDTRRKPFFRRLAWENGAKMVYAVEFWEYGNIPLIIKLIGQQIDLLKHNLRRLVLLNIAEGDEKTLAMISEILLRFCEHLISPSIERISELNILIGKLPYSKHEVLTKGQTISRYFSSRPRFSRLLFAFGIAVIVTVFLLCFDQNIGVIFAVAVTSFWGAFMGFDKLFKMDKR